MARRRRAYALLLAAALLFHLFDIGYLACFLLVLALTGRDGGPLADLLRVLLKAKADGAGVAPRLIAATSELDALSAGKRDMPALQGWRKEVFGADALKLCDGKVGLAARKGKVDIIEL